jgi:hypothetical protein
LDLKQENDFQRTELFGVYRLPEHEFKLAIGDSKNALMNEESL